jgi:hypothetical protein
MTRKKLVWIVGTKVALTLALTFPLNCRGSVEYWALTTMPGLRPGSPVALYGEIIGRVVATSWRGDTTFIRVRFKPDAHRLPGSRVVQLRLMGFGRKEQMALEIRPREHSRFESFTLGGKLRVLPRDLHPYPLPDSRPPSMMAPPPPAVRHFIPLGPPPSRRPPLLSA